MLFPQRKSNLAAANGAGDTNTPTWIKLVYSWLLQIPAPYSLAQWYGLGPQGAFITVMVAESSLALIGMWLFRQGKWKLEAV